MDKYGPKFSNVLITPDPHYIPGYTGYCPQLKFNIGKPYAKLTEELLTCPEVRHSNYLVLSTGCPSTDSDIDPSVRSLRMIPGYTGFIPKSEHYFSCSYAEASRKALAEVEEENRRRLCRQSTELPLITRYRTQHFDKPIPPLTAICDSAGPYRSLKPFTPTGRPYSLEDDNPHKHFISGYSGHVPKSRFLIGKSYSIITNQALIQFGWQQNDFMSKDSPSEDKTITLYSSTRGMVPYFTGHIPGYRFMYGQTFGQQSQNALEQTLERIRKDHKKTT
ncbi:ciliary microtubule inner protein 2B [Pholidichthys leucotaenia]